MRVPDFFVIGGQKCGSSWLIRRLAEHPDVGFPGRELHHFTNPEHLARGVQHFHENAPAEPIYGEKTPKYLTARVDKAGNPVDIPARMFDLAPEARIIAVLRDPVERAVSAAKHWIKRGRFPVAKHLDSLLLDDDDEIHDRAKYADGLRRFEEHYGRDRMMVLIFEEDVVAQPEAAWPRLVEFLGLQPWENPDLRTPGNVSAVGPLADRLLRMGAPRRPSQWISQAVGSRYHVAETTKDALAERYAPLNEELFQWLGREVPSWRRRKGQDQPE